MQILNSALAYLKIKFRIIFPIFFTTLFILIGYFGKIDKEIILPGGISKINNNIKFSTNLYPRLHTTSVGVIRKPNYYMLSILSLFRQNEVVELPQDEKNINNTDDYKTGRIYYEYSYQAALINAYKFAAKVKSDIKLKYEFLGLRVLARYDNLDFEIGDLITKINDTKLELDNFTSFNFKEISSYNLYNETKKKSIKPISNKIYFRPYFRIDNKNSNPSFDIKLSNNVGGPSGGFMQTLYIYLTLLNDEKLIAITNKYKIAGTGTIKLNGEVGLIGGVVQKVHTVLNKKCDVFFLPRGNYYANEKKIKQIVKNKSIKLITIVDFTEGIAKLKELL